MKVLILSMTVGQGHNSASKAIAGYLEQKGHECDILDTYKFLNRAIGEAFDKGYTLMGRIWPSLNENIYSTAEKYNGRAGMKMYFPWLFADMNKQKLKKYIEDYEPDVIICTIVMTAMIVSLLKDSGMVDKRIKTVGIVTDYSLHPFWEYTDMDYFVCPNELMVPAVVNRGIPREKILPFGIPIDIKYSKRMPTNKARKKLGLEKDIFTILMSAGGMGFAGMLATAKELDELEDIQLVAVCGTNTRLRAKMNEIRFRNNVEVLGFVDNMDEYLDACDIFITKPGGLSTSEAIAKRKPLLLTKPMPGVENMNLAFLVNHSLAVHANKYQPETEVIAQLRKNDQKLDEMKIAQGRWGKKDSAIALGEFLERLV
jgi:processive 1,2-diacylglycerol beta-glucosyltransferase